MVMRKKIVVPIDFSEAADAAVQCAEELAEETSSELIVLHVIDDTPMMLVDGAGYLPAEAFAEYEALARAKLEACVERARQLRISARSLLLHGRPEQTIVDTAEREDAGMIVIGTHGRRGFRRFMIGSVAERVVRMAKVPVLVVR